MRVVAPAGLIAERYRLLNPLGSGSSATVWAAPDETLGRRVALKLLSDAPTSAADGDGSDGGDGDDDGGDEREQLRREAQALAALTHPHIIVVFDFLETPGFDGAVQPVLVTELLEGRSLAARLAEGPLPWREALSVCGQLASALAAAHRAGIVHRDVAPGNVMLTSSGVKLLDFGLAEAITTVKGPTDDGMTVGTPVCMAPEQLMGHGALPASDVYALGCVLHWCLTGRPPYRERDLVWLSQAHLRAEPPQLRVRGLPEGINELFLACLAKEPDERPTAEEATATLAPYAPASAGVSVDVGATAGAGGASGASGAASSSVSSAGPKSASASASTFARAGSSAGVSAGGPSRDDEATELLSMLVPGGVAAYVSRSAGAGGAAARVGSAAHADTGTTGSTVTGVTAGVPPPPAALRRHAGRGRPIDRRRLLPLAVLLAAVTIIALMMVGLAQTMDGTGTSATRATGGSATASAGSPGASAAAMASATTGGVILPGGSAAASAPNAASPSVPALAASAPASAATSVFVPPGMSPSLAAATGIVLPPLPNPVGDVLGYVQALGNQVQLLIGQGPGTLQADAGQNLLNSLGSLQNLIVTAQQHPGNKQWRDVANAVTGIEQQISNDVSAGQISVPAANLLVGELQSLAAVLPAGNSNGAGNGG